MPTARELEIEIDATTTVSALLLRPSDARALYVLAHGAGAGMRHSFMESIAEALASRGIATLRYQFPYMEKGSKRPDSPAVAIATVRAAIEAATRLAKGLLIVAGGKSFGGRMTSQAASKGATGSAKALIFLGFPLHPPEKVGIERAAHLDDVKLPMLFLTGTRDELADLELLRGVTTKLGPRATLHVVEAADHAFEVLKRSGRTNAEVMDELADSIAAYVDAPVVDATAGR